jgi:DNA primase
MIPDAIVQRVADASPIETVIGEYVQLKKAGATYKGLCPFHSEKTPSFVVNPARCSFKCFGCGAGGTVFRFLMDYEGISFPEAAKRLADKAGIHIEENLSPQEEAEIKFKRQIKSALLETESFYISTLLTGGENRGKAYLRKRGFNGVICRKWGVGLAPAGWTDTLDELGKRGISTEVLIGAGLVIEKNGRFYDRFRDRVMFSIRNEFGETVGFSGREIA